MFRRSTLTCVLLGVATILFALTSGCAQFKNGKCTVFRVTFTGVGHLPSHPQGKSSMLGVTNDQPIVAVGVASATEGTFNPNPVAVRYAAPGDSGSFGLGNGLVEFDRVCPTSAPQEPVRGAGHAVHFDGHAAVGSITCGGIDVPARWIDTNPVELLPLLPSSVSGAALACGSISSGLGALVGGFVCPQPDFAAPNAPRWPVIWKDSPGTIEAIAGTDVSQSGEVVSVGGIAGKMMTAAGRSWTPVTGRAAGNPTAWIFIPKPPPATGSWHRHDLRDETGEFTPGLASSRGNGDLFGHVVRNGSARACRWPGSPSGFGDAVLLPTLIANDGSQVNASSADASFLVGEESTPSGSVAVVWTNGTPDDLMAAVNSFKRNTIPADWKLIRANAISPNLTTANVMSGMPLAWAIAGEGEHAGQAEGWVLRIERVEVSIWICILDALGRAPKFRIMEPIRDRPPQWPPPRPADR